jgi:hypothetical protein
MGEGGGAFGGRGGFRGGAMMGAPPRAQAPPDFKQLFIGNVSCRRLWDNMIVD